MKKEKTNYKCLCGMEFGNKKDNYNRHINKMKKCSAHKLLNLNKQTNCEILNDNMDNNTVKNKDTNLDTKTLLFNENDTKFMCDNCHKTFSRKFNLERHISVCKNKIINPNIQLRNDQNNNNNNISDKLNLILTQLNEVINVNVQLKKQIEEEKNEKNQLKKQIEEEINEKKQLKKQIKHNKKKSIINKTNTTNININQPNININNNLLINFDKFNYHNVDKQLFTKPIMDPKLYGKMIILQMIENVYINENHPEYHNFIVTDKNRGYVKIYNNGKWKTDNINTIDTVIDGIVSHSKLILIELKQQYINNININSRLDTSEKYINFCDLEHLEDLEDEQIEFNVNNEDKIKRCKDFRKMVYEDTINLFHDNKDLLQKKLN